MMSGLKLQGFNNRTFQNKEKVTVGDQFRAS